MNYLTILKNVIGDLDQVTLQKEMLVSNKNDDKIYHLILSDMPDVLVGHTFFNLSNVLKIMEETYDEIVEEGNENNGVLYFKRKNSSIKQPFSKNVSSKNIVKMKSFLEKQESDTDVIEFDLTVADVTEIKKFQAMFKTNKFNIVSRKNPTSDELDLFLEIKGLDEDGYEKKVGTTNFKINDELDTLPNGSVKIKYHTKKSVIEVKTENVTIFKLPPFNN